MNDLTLYQLADEYRALMDLAASEEADEESFALALDAIQGDLKTKAVAVAQVARNLEAFYDQVNVAMAEMKRRAERACQRAENIRRYLKEQMERAGIHKVESPFFTLALRLNPPRVAIDDETALPTEYWRVIPERREPDKSALLRAWKSGNEINGCHLENSTRLEIK